MATAAKNNKRRTITIVFPKGAVTDEQYRDLAEAAWFMCRGEAEVHVDEDSNSTAWNDQMVAEPVWRLKAVK